jgi:hypothetical protein
MGVRLILVRFAKPLHYESTTNFLSRAMVNHLHGSQSQTQRLCLLHQPEVPRLLLPLLQGRPACQIDELARQSHSQRIRVASNTIPEYARSLQWLQVALCEHAEWSKEVTGRASGLLARRRTCLDHVRSKHSMAPASKGVSVQLDLSLWANLGVLFASASSDMRSALLHSSRGPFHSLTVIVVGKKHNLRKGRNLL